MSDDFELLRQWTEGGDEQAFRSLVDKHLNLVYSVARRSTSNPHQAEEVTQSVFIILARKAKSISHKATLAGWLYRTAQYAAAQAVRAEARRNQRQEKYSLMENQTSEPLWEQIAPYLEDAMKHLGVTERDAIILRFLEDMSLRDVGQALGLSEEAARKRVQRGLEKLRSTFSRRGISTTTAILAALLSANGLQAAPVGLAAVTASTALAQGAALTVSTASIVNGTIQFMAWTKMKIVGIAAVAILLGGVTTVVVRKNTPGGPFGATDPIAELRSKMAAAGGTPEQIDNLVCVDNLKQVGAAFTQWTQTHNGTAPQSLLVLKDSLDTPQRLHCPNDIAKKVPKHWSDVQARDISYSFLDANSAPTTGNPITARCPIHGHVLLPGGQVVQGQSKTK